MAIAILLYTFPGRKRSSARKDQALTDIALLKISLPSGIGLCTARDLPAERAASSVFIMAEASRSTT
jgi:hypothetical protein